MVTPGEINLGSIICLLALNVATEKLTMAVASFLSVLPRRRQPRSWGRWMLTPECGVSAEAAWQVWTLAGTHPVATAGVLGQ